MITFLVGLVVGAGLFLTLGKRKMKEEDSSKPQTTQSSEAQEPRGKPENSLLSLRTISQMLKIAVVPEIQSRVDRGLIQESSLPIFLGQFRFIQKVATHGGLESIVELNDEVQVSVQVKIKRAIVLGQQVTLDDIYPEECFINPPIYNGKPAAYFFCQSSFLDFSAFFDFSPNAPGISVEQSNQYRNRYPILDFINAQSLYKTVRPLEQWQVLSDANWPLGPGCYPNVLIYARDNAAKVRDASFAGVVSQSYNQSYWNERFKFWEETTFFPDRLAYIKRAVHAHFDKDFISSVYVIIPQFEGIIKHYLGENMASVPSRFVDCVQELKELVLCRKVLMFPRSVLDAIFEHLENGSFWKHTSLVDPSEQINRHGILHGVFTGFEAEAISLKYLLLLDSLAFVLLHDKMLNGTL